VQLVEEGNTLADQLDLLGVVELEAEGAGGYGCGQGCQCRAFFQYLGLQAGSLREQRGGTSNDASADDDEVGGLRR